jgi:hypothetical protein
MGCLTEGCSDLLDCLLAKGLEDSDRPAGAVAVVQEQHDFADLLCLLPCVRDPLPALGADSIDSLQIIYASVRMSSLDGAHDKDGWIAYSFEAAATPTKEKDNESSAPSVWGREFGHRNSPNFSLGHFVFMCRASLTTLWYSS